MSTSTRCVRIGLLVVILAFVESAAQGQGPAATTPILPMPTAANKSSESPTLASPPVARVDYYDGRLTIDAQNSTLAAVLKLVAQKTGASINVPPGSGLEPIVEHIGPGPAKAVLEHLLNGSSFNFVIVSSPQSSGPQEILLTLQHTATSQVAQQPTQAPAQSVLWTPPDTTQRAIPLSAEMDDTLVAPKEAMTSQALSEFMRQKQRELREKAQQQYPQ